MSLSRPDDEGLRGKDDLEADARRADDAEEQAELEAQEDEESLRESTGRHGRDIGDEIDLWV